MKKIITLIAVLLTLGFAPANAQDEGQMWWGYYNGTQKTSLYGSYQLDTYEAAMFVSGSGDLEGVTINGARFQSRTYSNATDCKIWVRDSLNGENIAEVEFTPSTSWISGTFETPVTLPSTGVYVGYTFTIGSWYSDYDYTPIVYCSKVVKNGFWVKSKYKGGTWENQSSSGALAGQILISGGNLATNRVAVEDDVDDMVTVVGKEIPVTLQLTNLGTNGVKSIDYTYTLDDAEYEGHADLATPIEAMYEAEGSCDIVLQGAKQAGVQEVKITVTKVNGEANEETEENVATFHINVLEQGAKRKSLVETYVGASKYYSPLAYVGMEEMVDSLGDDVIPVAIHVGDAMALDGYTTWVSGMYSYPTCQVDRDVWTHPYYGNATAAPYHFEADKVIATVNEKNVAEAEVYVNGTHSELNEDGTYSVEVDAYAKFLFEADGYGDYYMATMIVVDSVSGEGSGWDQYNYICYYKSSYPDDDMAYYRDECGYTITGLKYNNVVAAVNDVTGVALEEVNVTGDSKLADGTYYKTTYTTTLPAWAGKENMRAVAALINSKTNLVVNAAVTELGTTNGVIETLANENSNAPIEVYNLNGQRIVNTDNLQSGFYIIKQGNNAKKVLVK